MNTTKLSILCVALLCAMATWAQSSTSVSTDSELRAAIQTDGANITVTADIDLSNSTLSIASGTTVTINLGGHTLDRKLKWRGEGGGQVITVREGATLNLSSGTLQGGWGRDGGGLVNEGGTVELTDVNITNNTADDRGGGISNHGTLTMTRGSISGNTTNDQTAPEGGGGIMNSQGATATLSGVSITGNTVNVKGGGGICNYGTMTLDGCTITGNSCKMNGGGIWTAASAKLNMQGVITVTDNTSDGDITNNLFLKTNAVVTVIGSLAGSNVGVNMEATAGTFTSGYGTHNSGVDPATIFKADIEGVMNVSLNDAGNEAQLVNAIPEGSVYYVERSWDEDEKCVKYENKILQSGEYKVLNGSDNQITELAPGYYVVKGNVEYHWLYCTGAGKYHLILCDGAKLTARSVRVEKNFNSELYIYGQARGTGQLLATGNEGGENRAGIGSYSSDAGNIVIHGGDISATGGDQGAAGIGGGLEHCLTTITIYGGNIKAQGYRYGTGIGSGDNNPDGTHGVITIYGGNIEARGGALAAGIGGASMSPSCDITIHGGTVKAWGGSSGAGIGAGDNRDEIDGLYQGTVTINGGEVYAWGGDDGAGIGGGWEGNGADVTINGGLVKAWGDGNGAGIGSGSEEIMTISDVHAGKITINDGEVYAYGGVDAAGIGGGEDADGGTIVINGGYVYAQGQDYGPGIGGGQGGKGANVTITGGTVITKAGRDEEGMRAIGPGEGCDDYGSLTIGDKMMVLNGDATDGPYPADSRRDHCWYRTQATIEPCTHASISYTVSGTTAEDTHTKHCAYCTTAFEPQKHNFVNGVCTVCGVTETDETHIVSYYLPGNTVNTEYGEPTVYQYIKGETITLPTAPDNIVPNDLTFAGWHVGTPAPQESIVKQPSESLVDAGTEYTVDADVSFAARYDYIHITLNNAAHNGEILSRYNGKQAQDVTLKDRVLYRDGSWNTLCLPFDVSSFTGTPLEGATVKTLSSTSFDNGTLTLNFSDNVTSIEAGKPYIVKWETSQENITDPVFNGVTINTALNPVATTAAEGITITFAGAYSPMFIGLERKNLLYLGDDNTLYYPSQAMTIGSCRAHFRLDGIEAGDPTSGVREFVMNIEDSETNGISCLSPNSSTYREGGWYTIDGRCLSGKPTLKGIYINHGHKIVIK